MPPRRGYWAFATPLVGEAGLPGGSWSKLSRPALVYVTWVCTSFALGALRRLGLFSLFHKTHCQSTAINHMKLTRSLDLSGNQKTVRVVVITHS